TIDMIINQQVALDEALVPHARRLKIGKSNFRLRSDITEMLHICPRLPNQTFNELPFEEEILGFLRYLGHSGEIKKITDVNINKLHQPWRSFAAGINKCLCGKNFVYQVEHKDAKKRNEIYYPRFTKVIINFFLTKDPSIPKRNKIKLATKRSLQQTHISQANGSGVDEGIEDEDEQDDDDQKDDDQDDNDDDQDTDNDNDDFVHPKLSTHEEEAKDEESFDPIVQTPKNSDDEGNDDVSLGMNVGGKEGQDA
nr:hypothetical protein [Tanacetum cinerariifolium]